MKRILVPVDFSPHTDVSCRYALSLANAAGAEIILFHSFFDQLYFSDGGFTTGFESGVMLTDEVILDFYKQKETRLNELAAELRADTRPGTTVKISFRMESGDPEVQIMSAIEQLAPDLIIMGSSGMGKKSLLSGSVARRIIEHADIPVIAVPDSEGVKPMRNVAYMTAFDPDDPHVISAIDRVVAPIQINMFCLHLMKDEDETDAKAEMMKLSGDAAIKNLEGRISFHTLNYDRQQNALRKFTGDQKIDLIAFIPHKRNILQNIFHQGLTKEDLFHTKIPIMAIKPIQ